MKFILIKKDIIKKHKYWVVPGLIVIIILSFIIVQNRVDENERSFNQEEPEPIPIVEKPELKHFYIEGSSIYDLEGQEVIFRGVSLPTLEWTTKEELSLDNYEKIKEWGFNTVRLPLNQDFWLNNENNYQKIVYEHVEKSAVLNLNLILDLHWSQGNEQGDQQDMPDVNSLEFWRQVADQHKDYSHVIFEIYNEPRNISSEIWLNGGYTTHGYKAVGMLEMIEVIRDEIQAENLIIVNGNDWGYDHSNLSRINYPNVLYGAHPYGQYANKGYEWQWENSFGFIRDENLPVILTEFGDSYDCSGSYNRRVLEYAERNNFSWIAWAWYPGGCGFPSLIEDWEGTPTSAGQAVKDTLEEI